MRGIESYRAQHRCQLAAEIAPQPLLLATVEFVTAQEADALGCKPWQQHVVEHLVLLIDELVGNHTDALQLLRRRQVVRTALGGSELLLLLEARDPDLEELVEVGAGNAQELQPLQQRHVVVHRLRKHAPVELQQRQLAVDVQLGIAEVDGVHGPRVMQRAWCASLSPGCSPARVSRQRRRAMLRARKAGPWVSR